VRPRHARRRDAPQAVRPEQSLERHARRQFLGQDAAPSLADDGHVGGDLGTEGAGPLAVEDEARPGPMGEGRSVMLRIPLPLAVAAGSRGGRRLTLGGYVTGTGSTRGVPVAGGR
jgi:hypothetical protein